MHFPEVCPNVFGPHNLTTVRDTASDGHRHPAEVAVLVVARAERVDVGGVPGSASGARRSRLRWPGEKRRPSEGSGLGGSGEVVQGATTR